ncbi:fructose-like specific PTS system EIIC component 2 [Escherichia coli]|uniref:Fructose-like specific PTS system EIIC component 2 n=1 Tax=Escherichia coli TaxID=562 RepID=A0A2X3K6Z6_ECOLX|nr:fructose-like specific PTS system EIIC component 2 [Escherichia coli]
MLAVIMGLMLAFDMGGPVNKVAYAFMLICVGSGCLYRGGHRCRGYLYPAAGDGAGDADWS